MFDDRFIYLSKLEEALKTGEAQNKAFTGMSLFDDVYSTDEKLIRFANGMTGLQLPAFIELAKQFNFANYKTHTDIGGSLGTLSIQIAKHNPNMKSKTLDLSYILKSTQENLIKQAVENQVTAGEIDFFKNEFPKSDVITMGMILHDWDLKEKEMLIKKAYNSLNEGGVFIAIENIIDNKREKNLFGILFSLIMLIETEGGFDFSFAQFEEWTKESGFKKTKLIQLAGPVYAAIAYK